jgi:hypothetical protein
MTVCLETSIFLQIREDSHFDALKSAGYKPQPITPDEFIRLHLSATS